MITATYNTTKELLDGLIQRYMKGDKEMETSVHWDRTYTSPVMLEITNPVPDLDFAQHGWEASRWDKFCKDYLPDDFLTWLENCPELPGTAESGIPFSTKSNHDHGNCAVMMSFRTASPAITLLSRVSLLIPTGILELSLSNLISKALSDHLGVRVPIYWLSASIQFSILWGFPYLENHWMPQFSEAATYPDRKGYREYAKTKLRYDQFLQEGIRPSYGRAARMLERTQESAVMPSFIPDYVIVGDRKVRLL